MKRIAWLACVPLLLVGCAASTPSPLVHPQPLSPEATRAERDAADLLVALQQAQGQIAARSSGAVKPVVVDAEAMLSMSIPEHPSIDGALRYFSTNLHGKIQNSLRRSAEYKSMIDKILDEYRLPRALAYLPVIESAYVPTLTSRAGAHGLWQFMPPTAVEYGLDIDWWVDERANPERSTRAAAHFLRDLHGMFGDWPLALAAYNAGPGRVRRALSASGSSTFWELYEKSAIPQETRGYVPTFYATVIIASDPETYGFELVESDPREVRGVTLQGPVSLDFLAEVSGASKDDLKRLNPDLRHGVVPPRATLVKLPEPAAQPIIARAATLRHDDPYVRIATFALRPGDTIQKIARALDVSVDEILRMNNRRDATVDVGESIFLPLRQTELSARLDAAHAVSADLYHTVADGDTLYSIARRYGLSVEELVDLNRLAADHVIHPGERLRVSLGSALTSGGM